MAIAFRNLTTGTDGSANSQTLTPPTGLADGDILVFCLYKENEDAVTWPSGFTPITDIKSPSSVIHIYTAWKRASGESGNYVASWTNACWTDAFLKAYSGCVASGDPQDATATTNAPAGQETNQATFAAITTNTNGAMVLAVCGDQNGNGNNWSATSTWTLRGNFDDLGSQEKIQATAGTVASAAMTNTFGAAYTVAITIALKPSTGLTVSLHAAAVTAAGQTLDQQSGAITKSLAAAALTASGTHLSISNGSGVSINLDAALLVARAPDLSIRPRVVFVNSQSTDFTPATASPVITAPGSIANGDLLLMFIVTNTSTNMASPIAGWTQVLAEIDDGTDYTVGLYYKIASGEGASWTMTNLFNSTEVGRAVVLAYRGVNQANPINVSNSGGPTTNTTISGPSVTPTQDNCMIVQFFGTDPGTGTYTGSPDASPVGTERFDGKDASNNAYIYIQEYQQGTKGALALDATSLVSDSYAGFQVAIAPYVSPSVIDLLSAPLISSGQAIGVSAPLPPTQINVLAAALAATGPVLDIQPGAISKSLLAAALQALGQTITVSAPAGGTTVNLLAAVAQALGQALAVQPGAVSKSLAAAAIAAAGQTITVSLFTGNVKITVGPGYSDGTPKQLARRPDGTLYIVSREFITYAPGPASSLRVYKANNATIPTAFTRMDSAHEPADTSTWGMAIDSNGDLHIVWSHRASWDAGNGDGITDVVKYAVFDTGTDTWGTPVDLETTLATWEVGQGDEQVCIVLDSNGYPHVVYLKGEVPRIVRYTFWNGSNWSTPETLATYAGTSCWHPGLRFDQDGRLVLTYMVHDWNDSSTARFYVRVRTSGTWGSPVDVTGANLYGGIDTTTALMITLDNRYHIAFLSATNKYIRYYYSDDEGATWSANNPGSGTELGDDPQVAMGIGNTKIRVYAHNTDTTPGMSYWEGDGGSGSWGTRQTLIDDSTPYDCTSNPRWSRYFHYHPEYLDVLYWDSTYGGAGNQLYLAVTLTTATVSLSLSAATLVAAGQILDPVPGAVSRSLLAAAVTAQGPTIGVSSGGSPISISISAAALSALGQILDVQPGTVTRSLLTAALTTQGQHLTPTPGGAGPTVLSASLAAVGQVLDVVPGSINRNLVGALVTAVGQALSIFAPPSGSVALDSALLAAGGQALVPQAGPVTKNLVVAVVTASGQHLTVSAPPPGPLTTNLVSALLATSGQSIAVQPGAVSKNLNVASLTAVGQILGISAGITPSLINLDAAILAVGGQKITIAGGPATALLLSAVLHALGQSLSVTGLITVELIFSAKDRSIKVYHIAAGVRTFFGEDGGEH